MNLLQPYLPSTLTEALGWTFLHSLWVITLLTAIFMAVNRLMKHQSAHRRYLAGLFSLLAIPAAAIVIFIFSYRQATEASAVAPSTYRSIEPGQLPMAGTPEASHSPWPSFTTTLEAAATYYVQSYHSLFVIIWLMGILLCSAKNIGGYLYADRLKKVGLVDPDSRLVRVFQELAQRTQLSRMVSLAESLLIKSPLVIGHLRPVILFPAGLAAGLSVSELEAILAHEIAHIKRHDFLINILQTCVEILFFYHPGVWIISSAIRAEREHCCDDDALRVSGDRVSLARALATAGEWTLRQDFALGFAGNKNSLLNRIKRIINNNTMTTQQKERSLPAMLIIAGLCLSTLTALRGISTDAEKHKQQHSERIAEAEVPVKTDENHLMKFLAPTLPAKTEVANALNTFSSPLALVPHDTIIDTLDRTTTSFYEELTAEMESFREESALIQAQIQEEVAKQYEEIMEAMEKYRELAQERGEIAMEAAREEHQKQILEYHEQILEHHEQIRNDGKQALEEHIAQIQQYAIEIEEQARKREAEMYQHDVKMKALKDALKVELPKDGLMGAENEQLNFSINNEGLFINDLKQSSEVYDKYRELVRQKLGEDYTISADNTTSIIIIL